MQARLSYAVAAHLRPDVLLVDEVLAVGDLAYQRKCFRHMQKYLDAGGSLVFVSHSPYHVQSICRSGLLLEDGRLAFAGAAVDALDRYFEAQRLRDGAFPAAAPSAASDEERPVTIESVAVEAAGGGEILTGADMRITLRYRALAACEVTWGFSVWTGDQWVCVTGGSDPRPRAVAPGAGEFRCTVPRLPLAAGSYLLRAAVIDAATLQPLSLLGWRDAPQPFAVRAPASRLNYDRLVVNQLTVLDVEWE
jgi:lipopolysaccharide transport system ATP-binding protein